MESLENAPLPLPSHPPLICASSDQAEISENEEDRKVIQGRIDELGRSYHNVAFLNLVSTFRLQARAIEQ